MHHGLGSVPPTFCTMSETVCDLANAAILALPSSALPHRMEAAASSQDDLSFSTTPVQARSGPQSISTVPTGPSGDRPPPDSDPLWE